MKKILLVTMASLTMIFSEMAQAALVVNNSYSGWYDSRGYHKTSNENYFTGINNLTGVQYHDFFVFDLSGASGYVTNATFNVYSYQITGPGTYDIYATDLDSSIENTYYGRVDIFNDLVSGPVIGETSITPGQSYSWLSIPVNDTGLSWLQASLGKEIVIGGSYTNDYIFGYSIFTPGNNLTIELSFTTASPTGSVPVPTPSTALLLGPAVVFLALWKRR